MTTYQLTTGTSVIRLADSAIIPNDERNTDYREYLQWLEAGGTPEPCAPLPVPSPLPSYTGFYDSLLISAAYSKVREQAQTSLPLTLAAVEFVAAMGDAKAGRVNVPALQACLTNIAAAATNLTSADWVEIASLLAENNLAGIFQLP